MYGLHLLCCSQLCFLSVFTSFELENYCHLYYMTAVAYLGSFVDQSFIHLIKNRVKNVILWNIITI